jgi:hypothetical protein
VKAGNLTILDEKGLSHPLDAIGSGRFVGRVEGVGVGDVEQLQAEIRSGALAQPKLFSSTDYSTPATSFQHATFGRASFKTVGQFSPIAGVEASAGLLPPQIRLKAPLHNLLKKPLTLLKGTLA